LIQPLLTPNGIGTCTVTPASETGIVPDNTKAGGDTFAGGESLLVRDYEAVLAQVDQVVAQVDKKPMQVAIEAMILSVKLNDQSAFGINFSALRDKLHLKLLSGTPGDALSSVVGGDGGLNFAFLDSSLGVFIEALETIGDTNVIATPHLTCINKHPAQILIGSQLGYISSTVTETSTAQNVNFLEVGAQLRLRPYISSDGQIRMEVHPELSTGQVKLQGGFTLPEKDVTQVTTNVMIRDGATVIIGGLMREDLISNTTQIPYLGSLPGVGWLFRQKSDQTIRSEILVLITPHIIYDAEACAEGSKGAEEFHRRQAVYADSMCAASKVHLGRQHYRLAQQAWAAGDQATALRYIDLSIHYDPANRAAIDLRSDVLTGNHFDEHTAVKFPTPVGDAQPASGQTIPPQILNDLQHPPGPIVPAPVPHHPLDPGVTGGSSNIDRPRHFESP
jgi:type IV pilus assembly protein PilQ